MIGTRASEETTHRTAATAYHRFRSVIAAAEVHRIEMIALGDNFATLVPHAKSLV
jgi:hypothetical protein